MTAVLGRWRVTYTPGDWIVLSGPTSLVVLRPTPADRSPLINALWQGILASSTIIDLARSLAAFRIDQMPSFGAFFWAPDGMRSLVRGAVSVTDASTGRVIADGEGVQTWNEVGLAGTDQVRIDLQADGSSGALELPLVVGVVLASAIVLDASSGARVSSPQNFSPASDHLLEIDQEGAPPGVVSAPPEFGLEESGSTPGDEDAETEFMQVPVSPVDEADPPTTQELLSEELADDSLILAAFCPSGHSNSPNATRCRLCDASIASQDPRPAPRPVLARLRNPDGSTEDLDRPVLIGRAPSPSRSDAESPRLMTVQSPNSDISRTHVQVAPEDWKIVVTDLHSTNGTILLRPDGAGRQRLPPGDPVPVPVNSVLELGDGVSVLIEQPQ